MKHMKKNGFTLIELLVALAISSIVGAIMVSAYQGQVRSKNTQEALTDMNQTARAAFEIMTNEIRMAGLDSTEDANARIEVARVGELIFSLDRRNNAATNAPDGDCCDGNEQIRYFLTNDTPGVGGDGVNNNITGGVDCHLGRETGNLIVALGCGGGTSGLQPLARNVDVLNFVYLAPDNTNLPADANTLPDVLPTPVAANRLGAIRSIQVTIVARAGTQSRGFFYDFTNREVFRNQQGEQILPAQNDHFRRLRIAATINCMNIGI